MGVLHAGAIVTPVGATVSARVGAIGKVVGAILDRLSATSRYPPHPQCERAEVGH
jgi:hypothetical protein